MPPPVVEVPRIPEPAEQVDVLREQLDYLIEIVTHEPVSSNRDEVKRFRRVRDILLEPWATKQVLQCVRGDVKHRKDA